MNLAIHLSIAVLAKESSVAFVIGLVCVLVQRSISLGFLPLQMSFEGPLSKWTNVIQGWQYRFFVLDPTQGMLSYYTVRSDSHHEGR